MNTNTTTNYNLKTNNHERQIHHPPDIDCGKNAQQYKYGTISRLTIVTTQLERISIDRK